MRVALYCTSPKLETWIKGTLLGWPVSVARSREEVARLGSQCRLVVIGIERVEAGDAEWLSRISATRPHGTGVVAVVPMNGENVRRLWSSLPRGIEVLWADEPPDRLRGIVARAQELDVVDEFHSIIRQRAELSPLMERALRKICEPGGPPPTVGGLARELATSRSTVRYYWGAELPLAGGPKELLDWVRLFRAVSAPEQESWESVARKLGVHRRTLERSSTRLLGCTLKTARLRGSEWVGDQFRRWIVGGSR